MWDFELRRALNRLNYTFSQQTVTEERSAPSAQPVCKYSSLMSFLVGDKDITDSFSNHALGGGSIVAKLPSQEMQI